MLRATWCGAASGLPLRGRPQSYLPVVKMLKGSVTLMLPFLRWMHSCNYDPTIIDPYGRILALTYALSPVQATLTAEVGVVLEQTMYGRLGDWVGGVSVAGLAAFAIGTPITMKRRG